jgi:hypothetical protein
MEGKRTIEWATATETGNDYFTIETSYNGADWSAIAEINGQGNSSTEVSYKYSIPNGVSTGDYFRLKQTDFNGQFSLSDPISAERCLGNSPTLSIYPNPTSGLLNVDLSTGFEENITFTIYSFTGSVISNGTVNRGAISLSGIPPGTYLCRLQTPTMVFTKKVTLTK